MFCAKISWNWVIGSGEENFLISSMHFRCFIIISPWKRAGTFIWTNYNPLRAKFGWNLLSCSEEDFLISSMYFHFFIIFSPWKKGGGHSFEQTWIPFTQEYFVPSLVEIVPVVLEKNMYMWKVYRQTDGRTDGRTDRRRTTGDLKSSLELSAQVS